MAPNDARDFGHPRIEPAHILLALSEEGEGVAVRAMRSIGTDPVALRTAVESAFDVTAERRHVQPPLAEIPIDETTDAAPDVIIELNLGGRTIRVTDEALAERLSSATTEEVLDAVRRLADESPEDPPAARRPGMKGTARRK